jgi:hypothetical protein
VSQEGSTVSRSPSKVLALTLVALAAGMLLSACGGPLSKADYEREASRIGKDLDAALDDIGQDPPSAEQVRTTAKKLKEATDELDALVPPDEVRAAHNDMIAGMRGMVSTFENLADQLDDAKGDQQRMEAFLKAFNEGEARDAAEKLQKAQTAYNKAGYTVFGDGGSGKSGETKK